MLPQPSVTFSLEFMTDRVQATTPPTRSEDYVNKAVNQDGYHATRNISKVEKGVQERFLQKQRQATVSTKSTPRQQTTTSHISEETESEAIRSR
jgi:hypothetical protein